jgi:hypothetical protein
VFLWAKGLNEKDINKEMFHVYVGKCLSHKAIHNWVPNFSLMTKRWRVCPEINVIARFEYHMLYVLYPFVTYLLTLPHSSLHNHNNKSLISGDAVCFL